MFPGWADEEVPKPGLYFGNYESHGTEVISFSYGRSPSGRPCFQGHKITVCPSLLLHNHICDFNYQGDPNVPAGELSLRIYLDQPLVLSRGELSRVALVAAALGEEDRAADPADPAFRAQPFHLPSDLYGRRESGYEPALCRGRFVGEGQIARTDFVDPDYTEVTLELLGPGLLGILWVHIGVHSLYFRPHTQPPSPHLPHQP